MEARYGQLDCVSQQSGLIKAAVVVGQQSSLAYIDGLVQDCTNSIANALELLHSCIKPTIYVSRRAHTMIMRNIISADPITMMGTDLASAEMTK